MAQLSLEEIIAATKRSSLPTVFVEGQDDMRLFNRIEQILGTLRANFMPCGDRGVLLAVFERRNELSNIPICFLADKDMWHFSGIPEKYTNIIFSAGYSIENDLYVDANIERILDKNELDQHKTFIAEICRWFACEVEKYKSGLDCRTDPNLHRLIPLPGLTCCPNYLQEIGFTEPKADTIDSLIRGYKLSLRGKLLYEIIVRFTHRPNRLARKYSYAALIEISIVYGIEGANVMRIIDSIASQLNVPTSPQLTLKHLTNLDDRETKI